MRPTQRRTLGCVRRSHGQICSVPAISATDPNAMWATSAG
jgi:hypothetical protein